MKKVTKLKTKPNLPESRLRENFESIDLIRADALNDLEILTEDFRHMALVAESVQRNCRALLAQNQLLKDALLRIVDGCECWRGNRCDRCQEILNILSGKNPEPKPDAARQYKAILTQLRRLG
jgi:hypothetical protein